LFPGRREFDVRGCYWGGAFDTLYSGENICLEVKVWLAVRETPQLFAMLWLKKRPSEAFTVFEGK